MRRQNRSQDHHPPGVAASRWLALPGAAVAAAGTVAGAAAAAQPPPYAQLPSPLQRLTASPPLIGQGAFPPGVIPGNLTSRQRVLVEVDAAGAPAEIRVEQRLTIGGKGDYQFVVPGPIEDVVAASGTESQPGLRKSGIVWQGFSPGRKVLAALATLRLRDSAPHLPLRISLATKVAGRETRPGGAATGPLELELRLENRTTASANVVTAEAEPAPTAAALDTLRSQLARREAPTVTAVPIRGRTGVARRHVAAPLVVAGEIAFPRGRVDSRRASGENVRVRFRTNRAFFSAVLGGGRPLRAVVRLRGDAFRVSAPRLEFRADAVVRDVLRPPARTWREAVRRRLPAARGRRLLAAATRALLQVARVVQYDTYLANPAGAAVPLVDDAEYVFVTAPARAVQPGTADRGGGGASILAVVLGAAGLVLGSAALVTLWAHL